MDLKSIVAIILVVIFVGSYVFVILRMYFLVEKIVRDNEKLKKFSKLIEEVKMKHSCPGLDKYKMKRFGKPPHYFSPCLRKAPDGDELILTVLYMNEKDNVSIGWGMRFNYCPACGEKLKSDK